MEKVPEHLDRQAEEAVKPAMELVRKSVRPGKKVAQPVASNRVPLQAIAREVLVEVVTENLLALGYSRKEAEAIVKKKRKNGHPCSRSGAQRQAGQQLQGGDRTMARMSNKELKELTEVILPNFLNLKVGRQSLVAAIMKHEPQTLIDAFLPADDKRRHMALEVALHVTLANGRLAEFVRRLPKKRKQKFLKEASADHY
jgi:hypothetical protein